MSLEKLSLSEFAENLASSAPTPGGGGASAAVAALGAALGGMVGRLTVGKKKYAGVENEILGLIEKADALREKLLACVEKDAAAFEPLSRAYRMPKDAPDYEEVMEKCLRDAAAVPMEILELCCEGIELHRELAEKGSKLMASDAATGAVLCWGAMYGAAVNVKVNTKLMKDRDYASAVNSRVDGLMGKYWVIADKIYEDVYGRYC